MSINLDNIRELMKKVVIEDDSAGLAVTPYRIGRVIEIVLRSEGVTEKEVNFAILPNLMYNYGKKGKINGKKDSNRFTPDEVEAYVAKYVKTVLIRLGRLKSAPSPVNPAQPPQTGKK